MHFDRSIGDWIRTNDLNGLNCLNVLNGPIF